MKLKPAGIIVVVLIIAALAYFAIAPRLSQQGNPTTAQVPATETPNNPESNANANPDNSSTPSAASATDANAEEREFNYTPEKPENGTLRGVVEVGASGFNS